MERRGELWKGNEIYQWWVEEYNVWGQMQPHRIMGVRNEWHLCVNHLSVVQDRTMSDPTMRNINTGSPNASVTGITWTASSPYPAPTRRRSQRPESLPLDKSSRPHLKRTRGWTNIYDVFGSLHEVQLDPCDEVLTHLVVCLASKSRPTWCLKHLWDWLRNTQIEHF